MTFREGNLKPLKTQQQQAQRLEIFQGCICIDRGHYEGAQDLTPQTDTENLGQCVCGLCTREKGQRVLLNEL